MKIILASASPRRRELLTMLGVKDLEIIPARGEENPPKGAGPGETVEALSAAKASEVALRASGGDVVIAADTIVWFSDRILGKPSSEADAAEMLRELSGNTHEVYTGVTVIRDGVVLTDHEVTRVSFRSLTDEEIEAYIRTGEPMDKAGAYGAQGIASLFVKKIEGDFFNVMGLPVCLLGQMLKKQGVSLL